MITLQIDGACKGCPFMSLKVVRGVVKWRGMTIRDYTKPMEWRVYCEHEEYCDKEVIIDGKETGSI